jgi:hypothetical protein
MDYNKLGISEDLINAVKSVVSEKKLHPNQEKLDKNKNGKLDADDFKKLRGESSCDEDEEQLDELSTKTLDNYRSKANKSGYSSKTTQQKLDNRSKGQNLAWSKTMPPENDETNPNKAKVKAGDYRFKKEEAEELEEAYRLPSDSEIDKVKAHAKTNHPNKTLSHVSVHKKTKKIEYVVKDKDGKMSGHTLGEDVEELDELSKKTLGSYVNKAHDQVKRHSAAVAFKTGRGDTDALRYGLDGARKAGNREDGIRAAVKKLTKEDVTLEDFDLEEIEDFMMSEDFEQLDELSKATLGSYVKKASDDMMSKSGEAGYKLASKEGDSGNSDYRKAYYRKKGINKAVDKLAREEVEELDEAAPFKDLHSAVKYATDSVKTHRDPDDGIEIHKHKSGGYDVNHTMNSNGRNWLKTSGAKHLGTVYKNKPHNIKEEVEDFMQTEDFEQLDELSKATLGSYVKKATADRDDSIKRYNTDDRDEQGNKIRDKDRSPARKAIDNLLDKRSNKRIAGLKMANTKLSQEQVEEIEAPAAKHGLGE